MGITTLNLQKAATGITTVGGTATPYEPDGLEVKQGYHCVDNTESNFILRPHFTFRNKPHQVQSDGTFSKGVRTVIGTTPILLADSTVSYQVGRVVFEVHPSATTAQVNELRRLMCQAICDSDTDSFYLYGSLK